MSREPSSRQASRAETAVRPVRLPLGEEDIRPTFRRERAALKRGIWPVAGCDEAGRGPLAGPVVAAAVIPDPKRAPRGLDDSKKLAPEMREKLHAKICATAEVGAAIAPPSRIDRDTILRAPLWTAPVPYGLIFLRPFPSRPAPRVWDGAVPQGGPGVVGATAFHARSAGDLPSLAAGGHEFQLGTYLGPPLAFWLAELAFNLA